MTKAGAASERNARVAGRHARAARERPLAREGQAGEGKGLLYCIVAQCLMRVFILVHHRNEVRPNSYEGWPRLVAY